MQSRWMERARWDALVRGEGCPLCAELTSGEQVNEHGSTVTDLRASRLRVEPEGLCRFL